MHIAIVGTGNVGGALARHLARAGHQVVLGVRDPGEGRVSALVFELEAGARAAGVEEAVAAADVVVFAIPGAAMAALVRTVAGVLEGKVVVDATNQMGAAPPSAVAAIRAAAPGAQVARAFNSLGFENVADPRFGDVVADMLYCSEDGRAREATEELISACGLRPVRVGDLAALPIVDGLLGLWAALAFSQRMGRNLAFKVLTR